ncbi:T9SS type A sorting domain-containing protein [Mucilaginibacter sp. Bleaf8]|uniref:T9SS type A sorting domain-containing protein n=1 Tax=Mucilaginibacter sp. Bleaf8 TaxID=2834430 RepID=UPI001BCC882C|nr:T9SS type A sorting domain-containing protein [Mucilaginibacter sp. Bleaf8]MBS7563572.1 T9SS type A sorting domain-containing protein [Mucilaginibacter sp. Bleaf8]
MLKNFYNTYVFVYGMILSFLCAMVISSPAFAQTEQRIKIVSAIPSENTGQDYSPWLNDNTDSLVAEAWENNFKYVDVTLQLQQHSTVNRLSFYDYTGVFTDKPAEIYIQNGTQKTLVGTFTGPGYMTFQDLNLPQPMDADAIIIHKYSNNIPQKVFVYGYPGQGSATSPTTPSVPLVTNASVDTAKLVKIPIETKRWYQINSDNDALEDLFDGIIDVPVRTSHGKIFNNYEAYYPINAGEKVTLSKIKFFDGAGMLGDYPVTLYAITNSGKKVKVATFIGDQYNGWVGPYPDRHLTSEAQYKLDSTLTDIKFLVLNCWYQFPTEMELYGTYQPAPVLASSPVKRDIPFSNYFGVNAFEWDFEDGVNPMQIDESRLKAMKTFTQVRHYMDWQKLESQQGSYTFSPVHSGGWNYDAIYQRCKAEGIEVLADLKTLPDWMLVTYPEDMRDSENVPVRYGKDFTDPKSYMEQARVAFQYVARYGSNTGVDSTLVSVNPKQRWTHDDVNVVKRGMGLIQYIECDNERDKWWKGRKAYQTAYEYAANLSAFYDGHLNTMGPGVGVKNADPDMKVVMAGLASPNTDYVRAMVDWCIQHRGYKPDGSVNLCWDVINYHLYSNDAHSTQNGYSTRGVAPEVSEAGQVAQNFLETAHQYVGDMPVWVTELGYDVNQGSIYKAIPIGDKTTLQTQADWILRSALLYARVGVDRIFFYQAYDDNAASPIQFGSSGLINPDRTRKPAADYLYQTQKILGRYVYKQTLNADPIVDCYEYNGRPAYALLVPDEKGRTAKYTLDLGGADSASIYTPKIGSDNMDVKKLKLTDGQLELTVTETPLFVIPSLTQAGDSVAVSSLNLQTDSLNKLITNRNGIIDSTLKVYPNPALQSTTVTFNNNLSGTVNIRVSDSTSGRVYKQLSATKQPGDFSEYIDLSGMPLGIYSVEIRQGDALAVRRLSKVN